MKIIHFSDIHEGAFPAPLSLFSKRLFGGSNYVFRRKKSVDWSRLDALTHFVEQEGFDYVIISGDFTSTGSVKEFAMVKKRLEALRAIEGLKILAVPGNHDNYIDCKKSHKAMMDFIAWLTKGLVTKFPLRIADDGLVFYLSNHAVPRPIQLSSGFVDEETCQSLSVWSAEDSEKCKIAIGHYPLLNGEGDPLPVHKLLVDGEKVHQLLQTGAIDINLCGHIHHAFLREEPNGSKEICAGSLTMGRKANIIEIDGGKVEQKWKVF
ncbi:metallophosphoesterase [Lentisphaera profundi]|uniref:Metallophosphoesterase n=1 Tax=Lentisphaera profundi TaxID=1658616 RepID=A0ABY7VU03_9BACT|nr:metallophosphoesterase [Lentisphaera profundi]WDE96794.1 metallophosphoesterase [Lentisphaera profundi]